MKEHILFISLDDLLSSKSDKWIDLNQSHHVLFNCKNKNYENTYFT